MARVPGIILVGIGVLIIGLSFLFNYLKKTNRFNLFILISVVIIIWGIISMIMERIVRKQEKDEEMMQKADPFEPHNMKKEVNPIHLKHATVACEVCGLEHYAHANFCQKCGKKLTK